MKAAVPDQREFVGTNWTVKGYGVICVHEQSLYCCAPYWSAGLGSLFMFPARLFSDEHPVFFTSICIYRSGARPI